MDKNEPKWRSSFSFLSSQSYFKILSVSADIFFRVNGWVLDPFLSIQPVASKALAASLAGAVASTPFDVPILQVGI